MAQKPKCEAAGCSERTLGGMCSKCLTLEHNSKRKYPLPEVARHELQTLEAWRNYKAEVALKLSSTQVEWDRWEAQDEERKAQATTRYEARAALLKDVLIPAAVALFGIRSKVVGLLRQETAFESFDWVGRDFVREAQAAQEAKRKEAAIERAKMSEVERARLAGRAKVYLAKQGADIPDADEAAISASFDHAVDALIAKMRTEQDWFPVKPGEHKECRGWDGKSHRCDCGNTRPYFATDGESFEDAAILGIAIG